MWTTILLATTGYTVSVPQDSGPDWTLEADAGGLGDCDEVQLGPDTDRSDTDLSDGDGLDHVCIEDDLGQ